MDVILSSAFGVDGETQTNPNNSVTQKARLSLTVPWWVYLIIGLPYSEKWLKYVPLLFGSRFHSIADVASLVIKDRRQGHTYRKVRFKLKKVYHVKSSLLYSQG